MSSINLPKAYWAMDEASGDALDSAGGLNLTDNFTVQAATGLVAGARDMDPSRFEWFSHTDHADLSAGDRDFWLNLWVKPDAVGTFRFIAAKGYADGGANFEWVLFTDGSSVPVFRVGQSTNTFDATNTSGGALSAGVWSMLSIWHDSVSNTINICKNAGTIDSVSHAVGVNDGTSDFLLGANGSGSYYDGLMDETGWWLEPATAGKLTWLYNSGAGRSWADIQTEAGAVNLSALGGSFPIKRTYRPRPFAPGWAR